MTGIVRDPGFYKKSAAIAVPIALQSMITMGVNMMDTIMVGRLGENALSAVSLANQFIMLFQICCMGMGMGADMIQPMAVVTIGGLLYGTLLTLFVVPCIYDILNRKNYRKDEERLKDEETEESIPVIEG